MPSDFQQSVAFPRLVWGPRRKHLKSGLQHDPPQRWGPRPGWDAVGAHGLNDRRLSPLRQSIKAAYGISKCSFQLRSSGGHGAGRELQHRMLQRVHHGRRRLVRVQLASKQLLPRGSCQYLCAIHVGVTAQARSVRRRGVCVCTSRSLKFCATGEHAQTNHQGACAPVAAVPPSEKCNMETHDPASEGTAQASAPVLTKSEKAKLRKQLRKQRQQEQAAAREAARAAAKATDGQRRARPYEKRKRLKQEDKEAQAVWEERQRQQQERRAAQQSAPRPPRAAFPLVYGHECRAAGMLFVQTIPVRRRAGCARRMRCAPLSHRRPGAWSLRTAGA